MTEMQEHLHGRFDDQLVQDICLRVEYSDLNVNGEMKVSQFMGEQYVPPISPEIEAAPVVREPVIRDAGQFPREYMERIVRGLDKMELSQNEDMNLLHAYNLIEDTSEQFGITPDEVKASLNIMVNHEGVPMSEIVGNYKAYGILLNTDEHTAKLCSNAIDAPKEMHYIRDGERGEFVGTVKNAREYIDDRNRRHFEVVVEKEAELRGKIYTYEGKMKGRAFYEAYQESGAKIGDKIKAHVTKEIEIPKRYPKEDIYKNHTWNVEVVQREQRRGGHGDSGQKKGQGAYAFSVNIPKNMLHFTGVLT
jgi:hypothetical protein